MTAIKEFKQLFMLETYSKQSYIFESDKAEILDNLIETNKFITVSGARINVTNISSYYPIPTNPLYDIIIALPDNARGVGLKIIKDHEKSDMPVLTELRFLECLRKKYRISYPKGRDGFANNSVKIEGLHKFVFDYLYTNYPNNVG